MANALYTYGLVKKVYKATKIKRKEVIMREQVWLLAFAMISIIGGGILSTLLLVFIMDAANKGITVANIFWALLCFFSATTLTIILVVLRILLNAFPTRKRREKDV